MNRSNAISDPFAKHRGKPEPVVEAPAADQPAKPKAVKAVETDPAEAPAAKPEPTEGKSSVAARAVSPFGQHKIEPPVRVEPERKRKPAAQALLDFLMRWDKPTVRVRDICIYGPIYTRKREAAVKQAEVLVKYNWLIPVEPSRRDSVEWQIVRAPIIHPTVAALSPTVATNVAV
jgi:hypothetical protein